jgi:hypothetical protein
MRDEIINDRINTRTGSVQNIIITPAYNFIVKGTVFQPNMFIDSYKLCWPYIEKYNYETLMGKQPPCHYFAEFYDKDFVFFKGVGDTQYSWFLRELIEKGAIHTQYSNSLLIMVADDYRIDVPSKRLLQGLANYIITPLMRQYKLSQERVLFIDSILRPDAKQTMLDNKDLNRRFMLDEATYYDHNQLLFTIKDYLK